MEEGGLVECMQNGDGDAGHTAPHHSELPAVEHGGLSGGHAASVNMNMNMKRCVDVRDVRDWRLQLMAAYTPY